MCKLRRKLAQQKSGMPTDEEVREMAATMNDTSEGEAIDAEVMEREIRRFAERMEKYNTKEVGSMTLEREEGRVRFMFIQLNNVSTKAIRLQKMSGVNFLARKYDVGIKLFNEHGCNMDNAQKGEEFANWIQMGEENRCVVAYNRNDSCSRTLYQPGGTGIHVSGEMVQYVKKMSQDERKLGRWSSCVMWAHPNHKCRLVTAYNIPDSKPEDLMTNYQ